MGKAIVIKDAGEWVGKVHGREVTTPRPTQTQAIEDTRNWLMWNGGGALVVLGEDGQVRRKEAVG